MPRGSRLYGSPVVGSSTSQVMTMVVSAKNGSIVAVTGSGIGPMSVSLMAFKPGMGARPNMTPWGNVSSSIMPTSKVTCCHLPRGSVKRRSTYFTSLSLIDFRTSLAVFMNTPFGFQVDLAAGSDRRVMLNTFGECSIQYQSMGSADSDGIQPRFPCPDAYSF